MRGYVNPPTLRATYCLVASAKRVCNAVACAPTIRCRLSLRSCLCSFGTSYINRKNSYFKNAKTKTSTSFKTIKSAITIPIPECKSSLRLPAREKRHRSTSIAAACASPIRCRLSLRSCLCSRAKKNSIF